MAKRIDRGVFQLETPVKIESYASVVGEKEGQRQHANENHLRAEGYVII